MKDAGRRGAGQQLGSQLEPILLGKASAHSNTLARFTENIVQHDQPAVEVCRPELFVAERGDAWWMLLNGCGGYCS